MKLLTSLTFIILIVSSSLVQAKPNTQDVANAIQKAFADCEASGGNIDQCKADAKVKIQNKAREVLIKKIAPVITKQCNQLKVAKAQCDKALQIVTNCASNQDPQTCQATAMKLLAASKAEAQLKNACATLKISATTCSNAIATFTGCATNSDPQACANKEIDNLKTLAAKNGVTTIQDQVTDLCSSAQIDANACAQIQATAQTCSTQGKDQCLETAKQEIKTYAQTKVAKNDKIQAKVDSLEDQCANVLTKEGCDAIKQFAVDCKNSGVTDCLDQSKEKMAASVKATLNAKLTDQLAQYGVTGVAIGRVQQKANQYKYVNQTYTDPMGNGAWMMQAIDLGDADKIMNNNEDRCSDPSIEESFKQKLAIVMKYTGSSTKEIAAAQSRYASARKNYCAGVQAAASFQKQLEDFQDKMTNGFTIVNQWDPPSFDKKLKLAGYTRTVKYRFNLIWRPNLGELASGKFDPKSALDYTGEIKWSTHDYKSPLAALRSKIEDLTGGDSPKNMKCVLPIPYVSEASKVFGCLGLHPTDSNKQLNIYTGMTFKVFGKNFTESFPKIEVPIPGVALDYLNEARDNAKQKVKDQLVSNIGSMGIMSKQMQQTLELAIKIKNGDAGADVGPGNKVNKT